MTPKKRKRLILFLLMTTSMIASLLVGVFVVKGDLPEVKTAQVERRELLESIVKANGEIRPVKFINLTAEVSGRVTDIFVKEGDPVSRGQPLLRVDPTQQSSATSLQEAGLRASRAEAQGQMAEVTVAENSINSARFAINTARADLDRARIERDYAKVELNRNTDLVETGLISRSVYDAAKMKFDTAVAGVKSAQARLRQADLQLREAELRVKRSRAGLAVARARVQQAQASLRRESDLLSKTTQTSPIDGVIAHLPIQVGTFALANFQSTPLMIIADMSSINVEARIDESEVTDVKVGQTVAVQVDAIGEEILAGEVAEIAASAVTRSGQTIAQTVAAGSQEAKDFRSVIRLTKLSPRLKKFLRPGMSASVSITTDKRENVLVAPFQALVERESTEKAGGGKKAEKPRIGVFIIHNDRADFTPIKKGISGENEIEIAGGISDRDEIITGPYRLLRTLKDGVRVQRDNRSPHSG